MVLLNTNKKSYGIHNVSLNLGLSVDEGQLEGHSYLYPLHLRNRIRTYVSIEH